MATFHPDVVTGRMTAVRDAIDAGGAAGRLELCSANYGAVLASVTLGYSGESTGVVNGASLTLAGFPRSDASIDADGLAVVARNSPCEPLTGRRNRQRRARSSIFCNRYS